ncbi:M24 family metallopeptidase [Domibacillus robiginosus]|uniref:M24 family metallopeptidase n=1 Tax=Domibacillus robiginosus TaxID=1071054 RepID=UPI00067D6669|nr:Xaa-Pro peptidase family protein [Domibacillus robiginosus]
MTKKRLDHVRDWLQEKKYDMAFLHSKENVFYLTNFYADSHERLMGVFVFPEAEPFLVCPFMEIGQAKAAGWAYDIVGYYDHENPWDGIKRFLYERGLVEAAAVAVEKDTLAYARAEAFFHLYPHVLLHAAEEALNKMRAIKEPSEVAVLKKAAELADYGVQVGVEALKTGVTEMEVLAAIEFHLKKKGIREMSFSTMVLFGDNTADPHGNPGLRQLNEGDFVLFDLGVVLDGYCSDITRTVAFGHASEKQREIYETVLKAQKASLEKSKVGTRIGDLDMAARHVIENAGYGEYFPHRIGHGLGINVHEFPSMSKDNDGVLKEGMVYTIEPGIYVPQVGGVRIEDDVIITKDGHETLTNYPKTLQIIKR